MKRQTGTVFWKIIVSNSLIYHTHYIFTFLCGIYRKKTLKMQFAAEKTAVLGLSKIVKAFADDSNTYSYIAAMFEETLIRH